MSRPAVPHSGPALCGEAPAPSPEGGARLSRNRKPRKNLQNGQKLSQNSSGSAAALRAPPPGRAPAPPVPSSAPPVPSPLPRRQRAPLPAAAPGTERRLPVAPSASLGAASPGLSSGSAAFPPRRSGPGCPELRPPPRGSAPLSRHGSGPGSPSGRSPSIPRHRAPLPTRTPRPDPSPRAPRSGPGSHETQSPTLPGSGSQPRPAPLPANFHRGGRCGARGGPHLASGRAAGAPGGRAPGAAPSRSAPAAHSRIDPRGLGRAEPSRCRCVCGSAPPRREPQAQRARAQRLRTRRLPRLLSPGGPGRAAGGGPGPCGAGRAPRDGRGWDGTGETLLPAQPGGPRLGTPCPPPRVPAAPL